MNITLLIIPIILYYILLAFTPKSNIKNNNKQKRPISIIMPIYNEKNNIKESIISVLEQNYPYFEIIIIDDGSNDGTLEFLIDLFFFTKTHEFNDACIYRTCNNINITLITKKNEGKSPSLNLGIAYSKYALICTIDGDTILEKDSLSKLASHHNEHTNVIASMGNIKVGNRISTSSGKDICSSLFVISQQIEYIKVFQLERPFWSHHNNSIITSGAFAIYERHALEQISCFKSIAGEDMDVIVRIYKNLWKKHHRIIFVSEAVCWTQVPESFFDFYKQRTRWHQGLLVQTKNLFTLLIKIDVHIFFGAAYVIIFRILYPLLLIACAAVNKNIFYMFFVYLLISCALNLIVIKRYRSHMIPKRISEAIMFTLAIVVEPLLSSLVILYQFSSIYNLLKNNSHSKWDTFKRSGQCPRSAQ